MQKSNSSGERVSGGDTSLLTKLGEAGKRTLNQWKQVRSSTRNAVRDQLKANKPIAAIRKLTLALLEDPDFQPYHNLLCKAVELRHARRIKPGELDPWATLPSDLRTEVVKLEAFRVYLKELETLFDKTGVHAGKTARAIKDQKT